MARGLPLLFVVAFPAVAARLGYEARLGHAGPLPPAWPRTFTAETLAYFPALEGTVVQAAAMAYDFPFQRMDHVTTRGHVGNATSRFTAEIWRPTPSDNSTFELLLIDDVKKSCEVLPLPFGPPFPGWMRNKANCDAVADGATQWLMRAEGNWKLPALLGEGLVTFHKATWTRCNDPVEGSPFDYYAVPTRDDDGNGNPPADVGPGMPLRLQAPVGGPANLSPGVINWYDLKPRRARIPRELFEPPPGIACHRRGSKADGAGTTALTSAMLKIAAQVHRHRAP